MKLAPQYPKLEEKLDSVPSLPLGKIAEGLSSPIGDWNAFRVHLGETMRAYKRGRFDSNLKAAAGNLYGFLDTNSKDEDSDYWKAHTLLYELNDIFHLDPAISDLAVRAGRRVLDDLRALSIKCKKGVPVPDAERELAREKVIYCTCRGNELKRSGETDSALKLFEWLLDFTTEHLQTEQLPCFGTQSILTYHLGSIYRILEQHVRSEEMYTQTLALLYERSRRRDENDLDDYFFTVRKQAMAIGIGFGWVNLTRGFLRRAEHALTTARSLLARSSDPIVPSYIELLYGTIKRCRAGSDRGKLDEAIESLEQARRSFEAHGNLRYVPRACWELSLALTVAGEFDKAQEHLRVVSDYAERVGHAKWQTNVRILRSRILRSKGDCEGALKEAELALIKANECKSILPMIDARITLGEAKLSLADQLGQQISDYSLACEEFDRALNIMNSSGPQNSTLPSNPKIAAVCALRIAQCFARQGDEATARQHIATWQLLRSNVEHEWVRELADQVKQEVDGLIMNFSISATSETEWDYSANVAKLRRWLLTQALRHTNKNYSNAADLIGVKRATLYQWQNDARTQVKRARTSRPARKPRTSSGKK